MAAQSAEPWATLFSEAEYHRLCWYAKTTNVPVEKVIVDAVNSLINQAVRRAATAEQKSKRRGLLDFLYELSNPLARPKKEEINPLLT